MSADDLTIQLPVTKATVIATLGDGQAIFLDDSAHQADTERLSRVQRAVLVARLREHANLIEGRVSA